MIRFDEHEKLKPGLQWKKTTFSKKKTLFTSKRDFNLREKLEKCYIWSKFFMVLKIGHFGK